MRTTTLPPRPAASVGAPSRRARHLPAPRGTGTGSFWLLTAVVAVLNMVGLVMVLSASSVTALRKTGSTWSYFERQAVWTVFGVVALLACLYIDVRRWRRHARLALGIAVALLVAVLIPGVGVKLNGSSRWLGAGALQIQPSEFAKVAMLVFVADLLDRRGKWTRESRYTLLPVLLQLFVVCGLIMLEPNLGTMMILAAMVMMMLYAGGTSLVPLTSAAVTALVAVGVSVAGTRFRRDRFLAFLNPWKDRTNTGYQTIQSMVGLADGGLVGSGLGASRAKWGFLPYAHTDFIFAIIGEEFGLIGGVLIVGLFLALGALGAWVASRARDDFEMLLAVGITAWLSVQAVINIGAVIGSLPVTGVPLPFVSFGGSSLVVNLAATGMLLNIARHPAPVEPQPRSAG